MGAWMGWFPTEREYDALSMFELDEFNTVIVEKMKRGL